MEVLSGQHICVLGSTGTGKTFFTKNAILPLFKRIIVVDTEDYDFPDFPAVSVKRAIELAKSKYSFHVRVLLSGEPKADAPLIDELCRGLLEKGHDLVISWDEVTDYSDAHQIPDSMRALIRKSRKRGISVVVGTQRPAMLSKDLYANCTHHIIFYVNAYDAEAIKHYAPYVEANASSIPYGSYKSIYEAPDGTVIILAPVSKYPWADRKQ